VIATLPKSLANFPKPSMVSAGFLSFPGAPLSLIGSGWIRRPWG